MSVRRTDSIDESVEVVVPAARVADLVTTESADELLVYDLIRHHIHHLNPTSAVIWQLCDGKRSLAAVGAEAATRLGVSIDEDVVRLAIAQLADANLLDEPPAGNSRLARGSRRAFMRRLTIGGAVAVPMIASMTAPTAAENDSANASMCGQKFASCVKDADCCANLTCQDVAWDDIHSVLLNSVCG